MALYDTIAAYDPADAQEAAVQQAILRQIRQCGDAVLRRENLAHITASAFVVNPAADRILLLHHNLMNRWAWPGGHADGCAALLQVALRETQEETGVQAVALQTTPASLDIFAVAPHEKSGQPVSRHLHLSVAYLLVADDRAALRINPAENRAVAWQKEEFLCAAQFPPEDLALYRKLWRRARHCLMAPGCKLPESLLK